VHHPRKVVGISALKPLSHERFAVTYFGFEVLTGVYWALAAFIFRKYGTFAAEMRLAEMDFY
jgi:hypothetical protein